VHSGFVQQTDRTRDALQTLGDRLRDALAAETERAARVAGEERERQDRATGRLGDSLAERFDALREAVTRELAATRTQLETMNLSQQDSLTAARTCLTETLAREGKEGRELLQRTLRETSERLATEVQAIAKTTDGRLEQISGKVEERLDEGFKKTNETFVSVMAGLARIDEAQKKIDGLASNVIGLQEILGDKRSRGAFGEVQLEGLVRNALPEASFSMQHTFSTGVRADCAIFLPDPTGTVAVDSKFPLESYRKMTDPNAQPGERKIAERQFATDVKRHVEDIANKYLIPGETSDGAVMFVPAESVFAEIHDKHPELVAHAHARRVWIVSPTTMWATLNTARAVLKDVETRKQVHVIQSNLTKLGKEFERFDVRMKKLADHIRLAQQDAEDVQTTSRKISDKFKQIEGVELDATVPAALPAEESRQLGA
jgi:DNA recombination protein RmuC